MTPTGLGICFLFPPATVWQLEPDCNADVGSAFLVALVTCVAFTFTSRYVKLPARPKKKYAIAGARADAWRACIGSTDPRLACRVLSCLCVRRGCLRKTVAVGLGVLVFWSALGSYVFFNTTITIDDRGNKVGEREAEPRPGARGQRGASLLFASLSTNRQSRPST